MKIDGRIEIGEIRSRALEQKHRALPRRRVEPVQYLHGRAFRAAAVERRQHEAHATALVRHQAAVDRLRPSSLFTAAMIAAAWRSSVCARAVAYPPWIRR